MFMVQGRTLMTMTADADAAENANVAIINNGSWCLSRSVCVQRHRTETYVACCNVGVQLH